MNKAIGSHKNINLLLLIGSLLLTVVALWGVVHGIRQEFLIPASAIISGSGSGARYATYLPAPSYWLFQNVSDSMSNPNGARTELFEGDKPIGPAHSSHEAIRSIGLGQFSHWESALFFSTSDNSNPYTNGRRYRVIYTAALPVWVLAVLAPFLLISLYLNRQLVMQLAVSLDKKMSVPYAAADRKIRWRWGVLAAIAMALLSLYPQIDLWLTRGPEWQGAYTSIFHDEEVYAAYINGLMLGRPRCTQPLQVDLTTPPFESLFSIQVVPAYLTVSVARITGATVSQAFIVLTPLVAFLTTLIIFYLLTLTTGDERLAAVGALAVLLLGTIASRDSALFKWLIGKRVASGFFPFLRRYQPAIIFPAFFGYISLTWHAFTTQGRKAWGAAIAAGAVFALIVFSYFFLWTAALAWLACLVAVWLVARYAEWRMVLNRLTMMALLAVPAFAIYAMLLAHRAPAIDKMEVLAFTHTPDLHRAPEWIGAIVILLLIRGIRKGRVDWHQPVVLLATSLALMPFAVFNQQIITGRSLQPHHYELFSANYLSLMALVSILAIFWRGRDLIFTRRVPGLAIVLLACVSLCWGWIETNYIIRNRRYQNVERDRFVPVAKRLTALAAEHGQGSHNREMVLSPDISAVSDNIAAFAPQAPFWGTNVPYASGLSWEEQQERFFQYLYYCGQTPDTLENLLSTGDSTAVVAIFGAKRYWPDLSVDFKPLTQNEIQDKVRQYAEYIAIFDYKRARHYQFSYVVVYTAAPFDFSNIDRWYSRDAGERIGSFILYQVKLSDFSNLNQGEAKLGN